MSKPFERSIRTPPICTLLFKSWIMRIMGFSKAIKRMKNRRDEIVDLFVQMQNSFFILLFYCFERKTHLLLFIWEYTFRKLIVRCDRRIFQIDINICLLQKSPIPVFLLDKFKIPYFCSFPVLQKMKSLLW